jgi:hypothetical protein
MIIFVSTPIFHFPHLTSPISEVLLDVVVYVISPAAARWLATASRMVEWYAVPLDLQ